MNENLNTTPHINNPKIGKKNQTFFDKVKNSIRTTLAATGIAASTLSGSVSGGTVSSLVTIPTAATVVTALSASSCNQEPIPVPPTPEKDTVAPTINLASSQVDITGGKTLRVDISKLYIGDVLTASRSDNKTQNCKASLKFNGQTISSGANLSEEGVLEIVVTDEAGNSKSAEVKCKVTEQDISGLENLKNLNMKVDQEVNLLKGVSFGNGAELLKVEIEIDEHRTTVNDPVHFVPEYPGSCNLIITIKKKNGENDEHKVENLTIEALEYNAVEVKNIKPVDILPIIGQVVEGDKECYSHIEHLRIAEATRIRDMMRDYGTGKHSPEEYKELMNRLNVGMLGENPIGYDNYEIEIVGENLVSDPSNHAYVEWFILNTLIKHSNFKIIDTQKIRATLYDLCKSNHNKINIMGLSIGADFNKDDYASKDNEIFKEYDKEKNRLVFCAGGNMSTENEVLKNRIHQEDAPLTNQHSVYEPRSRAHSKNDNILDRHLVITFGTNKDGDIDQTKEVVESSKFPVGFHDKILFSGHCFPSRRSEKGNLFAEGGQFNNGKYATSFTNYLNVAMASLCFQIFAEAGDVDELLEKIRSTCLTDYIRFDLNGDGDTNDTYNGQPEIQPLQLMNPAGFFREYCMIADIPSTISTGQIINLSKGRYLGLIFDIPGTEVNINGQWIPYNKENESKIKSQNPMNLEWRLNGSLAIKQGYKGKTIKGKIVAVDDQRNGLNIDKEFSVSVQ